MHHSGPKKCTNATFWEWVPGPKNSSDDDKENVAPAGKLHKSLKLREKKQIDGILLARIENDHSRKYVPKNTAVTTKWTLTNFYQRMEAGQEQVRGW